MGRRSASWVVETRRLELLTLSLQRRCSSKLSYVPLPVGRGLGERVGWWAFLDSNQRPLPYQGSALTS